MVTYPTCVFLNYLLIFFTPEAKMTRNRVLSSQSFYELSFGIPKPGERNQLPLQKKRKVIINPTMETQHIQTMDFFLLCLTVQESNLGPISGPVIPIHRYHLHRRHIQQIQRHLKVDYPGYFHSEDLLVQVLINIFNTH